MHVNPPRRKVPLAMTVRVIKRFKTPIVNILEAQICMYVCTWYSLTNKHIKHQTILLLYYCCIISL